jgi:hypothetical protein
MSTHAKEVSAQDLGLRELTSSMIRFTNAVTLFSVQQMQNALGAVTDSQAVIHGFCGALDSISATLASQIDSNKKSTLHSVNKAEMDAADNAFHVADAVHPKEWLDKSLDSFEHTVRNESQTFSKNEKKIEKDIREAEEELLKDLPTHKKHAS